MKKLMLFKVGDRQFGVDLPIVKNIQKLEEETNNINLYDLPDILGEDSSQYSHDSKKIMLVEAGDHNLGLKVDRVEGVVSVSTDEIRPLPPIFKEPSLSCFPQVLKKNGTLILIVRPEGIEYLERKKQAPEVSEQTAKILPLKHTEEADEDIDIDNEADLFSFEGETSTPSETDDLEKISADIVFKDEQDMISFEDIAAQAEDIDEISEDIDIESEADLFSFEDIGQTEEYLDEISEDIDIETEADMFSFEGEAPVPSETDDLEKISADIGFKTETDMIPFEDIGEDEDVDEIIDLATEADMIPFEDIGGDQLDEITSDIDIETEADITPFEDIALEELDEITSDTDIETETYIAPFEDIASEELDEISSDIDIETETDITSFEDIAADEQQLEYTDEISSDIDIETETDITYFEDIAEEDEITSDIETEEDIAPFEDIAEDEQPEELDEITSDTDIETEDKVTISDKKDELEKTIADTGFETEADIQKSLKAKAESEKISYKTEEIPEPAIINDEALLKWPSQIAELADSPEKLETALTEIVKEPGMSEMINPIINRIVKASVAAKIKKLKKNYQKGLFSAK